MDRFAELAAFVAVCEAEGFAAGGRRVGRSPSAATRLIAGLEARLGVRLLNRTTRSLSPTDAGRLFLERARRVLAELAEAEADTRGEQVVPRGRLTVAAPRLFGRLHVAPQLAQLTWRHPDLAVELRLNDRIVNLVEEGIDVAIRIGTLPDSSLVARALGATRRVVVAAPGYLEARGRPQAPAELAGHDLVSFAAEDEPPLWRFERAGEVHAIPLAPRFVTNDAAVAIDHALAGGGLVRTLAYQVADALRQRRLEIVLAAFEPPPIPISAVYPSSRLVSAKLRALLDQLAEAADWRFAALEPAAPP
jgi:DNA-binding transcriptional LysR family regulator